MLENIKRILLVDDEETFLKMLHRHLKRQGFFLETALEGKSAARLIQQHAEQASPFDLVISDVVMPDMDGIALLKWIQQYHPALSVILLTGFGDGDLVSAAVRDGFDGYGAKPITPEGLLELIHRVDRHRRCRGPGEGIKGGAPLQVKNESR